MSFFFTPHSRKRFEERYGFRPTVQELSFISSACRSGEALQMRTRNDGAKVFRVKVRDVNVFPVMSPDWVIVTFLPADFLLSSSSKAHRKSKMAKGGSRSYAVVDSPRPYRRKRFNEFAEEA